MLTRRSRSKSSELCDGEKTGEDCSQNTPSLTESLSDFSQTSSSYSSQFFDSQDSAPVQEHRPKKSKRKVCIPAKRSQWVYVLPERALEPRSSSREHASEAAQLLSLPDPRTGSLRRYLLGKGGQQIFEVMEVTGETRSWLIGNSLQTDGSLFVCTPLDPLLLILPLISKRDPKSTKSEKFTTLDVLLASSPHATVLEALVEEEQWNNICDSKDLSTGEKVYRYNQDQTLRWLGAKVQRLASKLCEEGVYVGSGAQSSGFVKSMRHSATSQGEYVQYASGMIQDYLPPSLGNLLAMQHSTVSPRKKSRDESSYEPPAKRIAQNETNGVRSGEPLEDYSKEVPVASSTEKINSKLTAGQKAFAKIDKKGMKALSSFFTKKA